MKRYTFIILLLGATMIGGSGCKIFKKKCDCPKFSQKQQVEREVTAQK